MVSPITAIALSTVSQVWVQIQLGGLGPATSILFLSVFNCEMETSNTQPSRSQEESERKHVHLPAQRRVWGAQAKPPRPSKCKPRFLGGGFPNFPQSSLFSPLPLRDPRTERFLVLSPRSPIQAHACPGALPRGHKRRLKSHLLREPRTLGKGEDWESESQAGRLQSETFYSRSVRFLNWKVRIETCRPDMAAVAGRGASTRGSPSVMS